MAVGHPCERLLIAVTGSIHCLQLPQYLLPLRARFAGELMVMMSPMAAEMFSPASLQLFVDHEIVLDVWGTKSLQAPHIKAVRWADMFVVLPATANVLAKAANGIADDLISTAIVAAGSSVVFAPAMNPSMWHGAAVQRNVNQLRCDGHYVVEPSAITSVTTGDLDTGLGPTPDSLLPHLWHINMKRRRLAYWPTATAEPPRPPSGLAPQRTTPLKVRPAVGARRTSDSFSDAS